MTANAQVDVLIVWLSEVDANHSKYGNRSI